MIYLVSARVELAFITYTLWNHAYRQPHGPTEVPESTDTRMKPQEIVSDRLTTGLRDLSWVVSIEEGEFTRYMWDGEGDITSQLTREQYHE